VTDSSIGVLRRLGVPQERIIELRPPGGVSHTSDEAKAVLNYYRDNPFRKLIVVTSDLHSRRAKFTFERFLKGKPVKIMLAPVTDLKYGADNWWRSEDGIIGCQEEYIKLFYYHVRFQN